MSNVKELKSSNSEKEFRLNEIELLKLENIQLKKESLKTQLQMAEQAELVLGDVISRRLGIDITKYLIDRPTGILTIRKEQADGKASA